MKTKLFILVILFLSIHISPSPGRVAEGQSESIPQDARKIVDNCVKALGGEEAVRQFSNYQGEGSIKLTRRGFELPGKLKIIRQERKSWIRIDFDFGGRFLTTITAFDGKVAWRKARGSVSDSPSLNYESDLAHTAAVLLDRQAVFSIVKETEIEGKKAVGIEADVKGKKTLFFIDREKHTILEIVFKDTYFGDNETKEVLERRIRYGDYKKFGAVLFPTQTTIYQKGEKQRVYNLDTVTFKPNISPSTFQRPGKKLDMRYYEERID